MGRSEAGFLLINVHKMHIVFIPHHTGNGRNIMVGIDKRIYHADNPAETVIAAWESALSKNNRQMAFCHLAIAVL